MARLRAAELLERAGLSVRARHLRSGAVSGSERQRVAIARALSNEPDVVLADEPTGNLDSAATLDVLRLLDNLRPSGQTVVIVTHDSRIAATADRLISMRDGVFVEETRLPHGTTRHLVERAGLEAEAMGRALLVCRLAVLGLALHPLTSHPYQHAGAATRGPDLVTSAFPPDPRALTLRSHQV